MPRKGEVRKREILPDPKYGDKMVAKFVIGIWEAFRDQLSGDLGLMTMNLPNGNNVTMLRCPAHREVWDKVSRPLESISNNT